MLGFVRFQGEVMRELFDGWQRKAGIITLVIACAFLVDLKCWFNRPSTSSEIPETAMMLDVVEIAVLLPISAYLLRSQQRKPQSRPPQS